MDQLLGVLAEVIRAVFLRPENVALMVSVLANCGMGYFIIIMRREDREDRRAMTLTLEALTLAINNMRIVVAAALGKSV